MQDKNDEMIRSLVETVARLSDHLKSISEKLEVIEEINSRLKSIDRKTEDSTRVGSSRA
jgi:methyl-accepting chemotaxis protein